MSHFTVLVIGDNPEQQLAPYHEFECTGWDNEYVQDVDETEEQRAYYDNSDENVSFLEYVKDYYGRKVLQSGKSPDLSGEHKFGWVEANEQGEVVRVVTRTNPNAKWDWYSLGGRWTGYFPLKSGKSGKAGSPAFMCESAKPGHADQCRWGDVDMESARNDAEKEARERFGEWRKAFEKHGQPVGWEEVAEDVLFLGDLNAARNFYHSQAAIMAVGGFGCPVGTYGFDEEAYVAKCKGRALLPFAIVHNGQWFERGEMGWFASVHNEKESSVWGKEAWGILDSLDPDTMISLFDCHI